MIAISTVVLVAGVAAGFDLYLTLAVVAALALLDPVGAPQGAGEMASPLLLAPALAMAAVEAFVERRPTLDLIWRQLNALARPVGAAGLAALLLGWLPPGSRVAGAVAAGVIAILVHAARSGWALLARIRDARPTLGVALLIEDALVVALMVGLWWAPRAALIGAGVVLGAILMRAPPLVAAFRLSGGLVRGWVVGLTRRSGWRSPVRFPDWMKTRLSPSGVVTGGRLRGTPAACIGFPGPRSVRFGWLLVRGTQPLFAHRTRGTAEGLPLEAGPDSRLSRGPLCLCFHLPSTDGGDLVIVVSDDGPEAGQLRAELSV